MTGVQTCALPICLLFLLGALIVYRIGTHVPVPGINASVLEELFKSQQGGILGLMNVFSGGALSRFSILALGIMPYISPSFFNASSVGTTTDASCMMMEAEM